MTHSFSQTVSLTWPDCGQSFTADIWLVVDASERPDLLGRIHAGTLHDLPCPHCGHNGKVDAPILLYRPGATPPLLFSPARRTTAEQDREQAGGLLGYLHHALGAAWRDEWLAAMPIIPRHFLPAALSDDPKAALRQAAEEAMHPVLREVVAELAQSGVTINSQEELERALAARPDLQAKLAAAQSGGLTVPPQFQADIRQAQTGEQRYLQRGDRRGLDEAAAAWERIMNHPTFPQSDDRFQLAACNDGGGVFLRRYWAQGQITDLHRALDLWQTAVQRTPPDSPDLPSRLNNLGNGLRYRYARTGQLADLEEAIRVYDQALRFLDVQFLLSPVSFQLGQQRNWDGLFARAVVAHLDAHQPQTALAVAEGSKSRLLTSLLGRGQLPAPLGIPPSLVQQEQALAAQLNALDVAALAQHGASGANEADGALAQQQALVTQLQQVWQEMSIHGVEAQEYITLRRGDRPTWNDLARLAHSLPEDAAILSLFTTGEHILLFLLRPDASLHTATASLSLDDFRYLYHNNFVDEVLNRNYHWQTGRPLTHRWRQLGQPLLAALLPHLVGINHLIIAPEGALHLLPLHALTLNDQGRTLLDDFTISYIPALSLLDRLQRRPPITAGEAVVMGYTGADPQTEDGAGERAIFLGEAVQTAAQLGVSPALDEAASGAALRAAVSERTLRLLHLSCHGYFHSSDPLRSGVLLADGLFTARDFMQLRFQADLVTLSACETGRSGSLGGDEMAGLSQALLHAGASSLLMGLWSVNAFTTAALMADLYRRLWGPDGRKQMGEAQALREASLALRRGELMPATEHFDPSDPYYWAPFVLVGDWR